MDIDEDDDDAGAGLDIEDEARVEVAAANGNQKRTVDEVYKKVGCSASLPWTALI
jgi:hypothetical protein